MKHPKTQQARTAEANNLRSQLSNLGLPEETLQPVLALLTDFENTGQGCTTNVKIQGTKIVLHMWLSNQAHITSYIRVGNRA